MLITRSTLFQNDRKIAQIACEAFDEEPLDAVITTVEIDPAGFQSPENEAIELRSGAERIMAAFAAAGGSAAAADALDTLARLPAHR